MTESVSFSLQSTTASPAVLNLEQLKKRAKDLKHQVDSGVRSAAIRVQRRVPQRQQETVETITRQGIKLSEAQFVVARETGFASWPRLQRAVSADYSSAEAERVMVELAMFGPVQRFDELAKRYPKTVSDSPALQLALGSIDSVPEAINHPFGPLSWPPLMYLLHSGLDQNDSQRSKRAKAAEALLALGADPNLGVAERLSIRGYRTPLGAAVSGARNPELVSSLLQAGAAIEDGPSLYEGCAMYEAVRLGDVESLQQLLTAEAPFWHLCHALPHALGAADEQMVRLLLTHKADPNWNKGAWGFDGPCLHDAVMLDSSPTLLKLLLESGANPDLTDRGGRTPLQLARCLNREPQIEILTQAGADTAKLRKTDYAIADCFAGKSARGPIPELSDFDEQDHAFLARAIRLQKLEAARCLLESGLSPNSRDDDGQAPLHLAAATGDSSLCAALLSAGAELDALNYEGLTALDVALQNDVSHELVELLSQQASRSMLEDPDRDDRFEQAADAVVNGDLAGLRKLLKEDPALVHARSSRPHRCTLLNYLGANGFEGERQRTPANAVEVIDLLIEAGSDPDACCYTYRGGPGDHTMGLLCSSSFPREAGLTLDMVAALGRGGATLGDVYGLLVVLNDGGSISGMEAHFDDAFREAVSLGDLRLAGVLLTHGADVNAADSTNATALHQAALSGYRSMVSLLLEQGADPTLVESTFGGNAAGWANAGGHPELANLLHQAAEDHK